MSPSTSSDRFALPGDDEIEVSVFGPGYGESIVLHLGEARWAVIDSCIDHATGRPVPLAYLHALGVEVTRSVVLVVASHWHDDHIRGLSRVVEACAAARFVCSDAFRTDEFRRLLAAYSGPVMMRSSGLDEFVATFRLLRERGDPCLAARDVVRRIWQVGGSPGQVRLRRSTRASGAWSVELFDGALPLARLA